MPLTVSSYCFDLEISKYAFDFSQDLHILDDDRAHAGVLRLESDVVVLLVEGLDRGFALETVDHGYDHVAVARGVARLNVLCEWCMPFVKNGGYFVAMKGEKGREEAEEAKKAISVLGGELVDIIDIKIPEFEYLHTLVLIKKTKSTPKNYPRRNSQIQKKPL